jgi:putative SOS response-associated peptidase YedK
VILDGIGQRLWLDPETDLETLTSLLQPPADPQLQAYVVSRLVNSVSNDSPDVLLPTERPDPELFE